MPSNKQRREAARRKLEQQLAVRQEQARRRRRGNIIASVVAAVVVVAVIVGVVVLTGHKKKSTTAAGSSTAAVSSPTQTSASASNAAAPNPYPCAFKTSGTAAKEAAKPTNLKPARTGTVDATVTTTQGTLTFALDRAAAPCAVESFLSLASQNYFNTTKCHRLTTSGIYVLQCGDPLGTGAGGPGYTINDEYTGKEKYTAGTLAMAHTAAADSGGSQFFIVYKDTDLPPQYTIFGKVTAGLTVVDKVALAGAAGTTGDGAPKLPITIQRVTAPAKS